MIINQCLPRPFLQIENMKKYNSSILKSLIYIVFIFLCIWIACLYILTHELFVCFSQKVLYLSLKVFVRPEYNIDWYLCFKKPLLRELIKKKWKYGFRLDPKIGINRPRLFPDYDFNTTRFVSRLIILVFIIMYPPSN